MTNIEILKKLLSHLEMNMKIDFQTYSYPKALSFPTLKSIRYRFQWNLVICPEEFSKNIFNFTVKYINNALPTNSNLAKWNLSSTSNCSFCLLPESILHIISGCKIYLNQGCYTWRHDSVLLSIATFLQSVKNTTIYADLPKFLNPSILTGDSLRPDLLLSVSNDFL